MLKKINQKLASEKNLVLIDQVVFSGTSFVVTALLARFLPIDLFGAFSSIILAVYLVLSVSNAMVIQPMQVAYSRFGNATTYFGFTLFMQLVIALIAATAGLVLGHLSAHYFQVNYSINWHAVAALVLFWLLHDYFRKTFLAKQAIKKTIVVDCVLASIQLGGIIGLYLFQLLTLNAAITVLASGYAAAFIVAMAISQIPLSTIRYSATYFTYHKKEGAFLVLSSLLQWWSSNLFVIASGLFLGSAALGAFRLVQSMFGVLNILLQTYENYVLPKAAKLYADSLTEAKLFLRLVSKKGAVLFALVLVPLFLFSKQAILLVGGPQYQDYHFVVKGMVLLYAIIYSGYAVRLPIRMLALNKAFFIGYCISFAFSAATFHYLLQNFNLIGAISGLIINQLLMISYWHFQLKKSNFILWK
jgi:O-antigen/teichoic acid export membrane protein